MSRTDKQLSYEERYKQKMEKYKEVYAVRTDFASKFKLKPEKTKGYYETGDVEAVGPPKGDDKPSKGSKYTGTMPTVDDYTGPETTGYQSNLPSRIKGTDKWNDLIVEVCEENGGVNPILVKCIMVNEQAGTPGGSVNGVGYVGIMQVNWNNWKKDSRLQGTSDSDVKFQIDCGVKELIGKYKNTYQAWVKAGGKSAGKFRFNSDESAKWEIYNVAWFYLGYTQAAEEYPKQLKAVYEGLGYSITDPFYMSSDNKEKKEEKKEDKPAAKSMKFQVTRDLASIRANDSEANNPSLSIPVTYEPTIIPTQEGVIKNDKYVPPKVGRRGYAENRVYNASQTGWKGWKPLDKSFIHLAGPQENLYSPEAHIAFQMLRRNLDREILKVIHGFEPNSKGNIFSMHHAGMAIDIYATNIYDALFIADTAWTLGLRAVAIGGSELDTSNPGFVHIDCGPQAFWPLNHHDVYKGPNTFRMIER